MGQAPNTDARISLNSAPNEKRKRLIAAIRRLEDIDLPLPQQRVALAEACFRLAILPDTDGDEAVDLIQNAIEHDPYHPKFFFHLGRLLSRAGDHRSAVAQYRHALKLAPSSHRVLAHLAIALLDLGEDEKKIAREMLEALSQGDQGRIDEQLAKVDMFVEAYRSGTEVKKAASASQKKQAGDSDESKKGRNEAFPPSVSCRWDGIWRVALIDHLLAPKTVPKQIDKQLTRGASSFNGRFRVAEYATACLMLMLAGESPKVVAGMLNKAPELKSQEEHPAVKLLRDAAALAESENPHQFVERAARLIEEDALPVELICVLHYSLFGPESPSLLSAPQSLRLLDGYPAAILKSDCFRELRLAVLDGYARLAWRDERFGEARLLWREALPLDPARVSIAHNLALLAARTKCRDDYAAAWGRASELRYQLAAAVGDLQVMIDDRRVMHLSFAQQARQHYSTTSTAPNQGPQDEELNKWLNDRDALDVWLREWDLYYLNSRLRFRSPVHLLGVSRDATDQDVRDGRDALTGLSRSCLGGRRWAAIKTFCDLAEKRINDAFERASDMIDRARDAYYEQEKEEADALAAEAIDRGFLLNRMLTLLGETSSTGNTAAGCRIARHLFCLPWKLLQPICVKRGLLKSDLDLTKAFVNNLLALLLKAGSEKGSDREVEESLSALDDCIRVLPRRVELKLGRCKLLLSASKNLEAYLSALESLPFLSDISDEKERNILESNFMGVIEGAAMSELPERLRQPDSLEAAKETLKEGRRVIERFHRAAGLRSFLASILVQLGDTAHIEEAIKLLEEGVKLALNEEQKEEMETLLEQARGRVKTAAALQEIKELLERASNSVNSALQQLQRGASLKALEDAKRVVDDAIRDAMRAKDLSRKSEIDYAEQQADSLIADLKQIQERLGER